MKEYAYCPKCGLEYNVSRLRDRSKVFVCADCAGRDRAKMLGRKWHPIYDSRGFATVRGGNSK